MKIRSTNLSLSRATMTVESLSLILAISNWQSASSCELCHVLMETVYFPSATFSNTKLPWPSVFGLDAIILCPTSFHPAAQLLHQQQDDLYAVDTLRLSRWQFCLGIASRVSRNLSQGEQESDYEDERETFLYDVTFSRLNSVTLKSAI